MMGSVMIYLQMFLSDWPPCKQIPLQICLQRANHSRLSYTGKVWFDDVIAIKFVWINKTNTQTLIITIICAAAHEQVQSSQF